MPDRLHREHKDTKRSAVSSHRLAIAAVTLTYVAVTVGESILAPILPIASPALGFDEAEAGRILGLLSVSAGVGNLVGGFVLNRFGAKVSSMSGVALTAAGATLAAMHGGAGRFTVAHVFMGLGAGVFFAGGIYSIGVLADPSRRGRAMGRFGIAYSLALAAAAGLVALIGPDAWRSVFAVAAGLAVLALAALVFVDLPPPAEISLRGEGSGLLLLGIPVAVGGAAAVAQFGLVAFVPTFAVDEWSMAASTAAIVLLAGRVLSIPGKWWAGHLADRHGALGAARLVTLLLLGSGLVWLAVPAVWIAAAAASVFAASAGAMFPVANVVAVERFGSRGGLLGVFRSAQMAIAGVAAWLVGLGASGIGLRTVLLIGVATLVPLLLLPGSRQGDGTPVAGQGKT